MTIAGPETEFAVREATKADLLSVLQTERASFPQPWPYAAFERFLGAPGFLVAEDAETAAVVGYVVADSVPSHGVSVGHVKDLAVSPDRRGEGIGSALLSRALTVLFSEGVGRVKLEVRAGNDKARALYESFGFERHHVVSGYYDDGEDALVMVRSR